MHKVTCKEKKKLTKITNWLKKEKQHFKFNSLYVIVLMIKLFIFIV